MKLSYQRVYKERSSIYRCETERYEQEGVTIIEEETLSNKNMLTLAHTKHHTFIRIDPNMAFPRDEIVALGDATPTELVSYLSIYSKKMDRDFQKTYRFYYYLGDAIEDQESCISIRRLGEVDRDILENFLINRTQEERELADIEDDVRDPVIFGGFIENKMVAYVSHRYCDDSETIGDIGIVVDRDYRGNGYGRAMLLHEAKWCLRNEVIPMYIVLDTNIQSIALVESLGFKKIFDLYRLT